MGFHNYGIRAAVLLILLLAIGIAVVVSFTGGAPRIQPYPVLPTIESELPPQNGDPRTPVPPRPPCALRQSCAPL